jgi:3-methyladenine DNA glycosylase/8-oxoguanine DNA glycosylase
MRLNLPAIPPFSLSAVLRSHGWSKLAPFNLDTQSNELTYIYRLKTGRVVELHIREASSGVTVDINDPIHEDEQSDVSQKVNWMLALDQDFSSFYTLARKEPKLKHVEENAQGRLLRSPTLFEDVVKTILTTNTAWGGTIRMTGALVTQFGDPLEDVSSKFAFPTPEAIAISNEVTLRNTTRLGYRSPYILKLAREVASGSLDLESLKTTDLPSDQIRKVLLSIKGIGDYAAANLLMLLGHYNYLTIDSWALKVISHEWYQDEPIGSAEVEAAFEKWGHWKGLAYWFWDWSYKFE